MLDCFELGDGRRVPAIGIGTFIPDGPDGRGTDESAEKTVTAALKLGYRHIDTAEFYGNEEGVGRAIIASAVARDTIFITAKVDPGSPDPTLHPFGVRAKSFDDTIAQCESSARKLGVACLDLVLLHTPLAGKDGRLAQYRALTECQKRGVCSSIGVSNFGIEHLKELENAGLPTPAANQLELHPLCQKRELLAYMRERRILPIAYSSLAPLTNWRVDYANFDGASLPKGTGTTPSTITEIAARLGVSEARLLLRYAVEKGWAIIPKSARDDRMRENLDVGSFALAEADVIALDALESDSVLTFGGPGAAFDPTTAA